MAENLETNVEKLANMAEKVGKLADDQDAAFEEKKLAETELLDAIIARTKPALRAISSRIAYEYRCWWPDNTCPAETYKYLKKRGVELAGYGPDDDYPQANGGETGGKSLYLLQDGTWLEARYSGHWSRWQGSSSEWDTSRKVLTTAQVVEEYSVPSIIKDLSEELEKQLSGNREKATARAIERTEKLRALTILLRK